MFQMVVMSEKLKTRETPDVSATVRALRIREFECWSAISSDMPKSIVQSRWRSKKPVVYAREEEIYMYRTATQFARHTNNIDLNDDQPESENSK